MIATQIFGDIRLWDYNISKAWTVSYGLMRGANEPAGFICYKELSSGKGFAEMVYVPGRGSWEVNAGETVDSNAGIH